MGSLSGVVLVILWFLLEYSHSYRILVVSPTPARSHYNLCKAVVDILHERGHEITFISSFPTRDPGYREIATPELMVYKDSSKVDFDMNKKSKLTIISELNTWVTEMTKALFRNSEVRQLFTNKTETFDLVITEFFMNDVLLGLGVKYSCPVIPVSPVALTSWLAVLTGNPLSLATVPNVFLPNTRHMDLWQRMTNVMASVAQGAVGLWFILPVQRHMYQMLLPEESDKVPFSELKSKIAVVFVNTHPSNGVARPLLPNVVEIGGYHLGKVEQLPKDLQNIMDKAKHGVILFSMGSNLNSSLMADDIKSGILQALGSLKQTVLWKFEEELPGKPDNVIISNWLPQISILAHPNTKLFISHGGLVSCIEAAHYGVPMLAVPIYGDQHHNSAGIVEGGYGLALEYSNLTRDSLTKALNEMLSNTVYKQNALKVQRLFHDRPVNPRDLVVFYTEHVIRTGGARHLSQADLNLTQLWLLDVAMVVLLASAVPFAVCVIALLVLYKKCFKSRSKREIKKKKGGKEKKN